MLSQLNTLVAGTERKENGSERAAPLGKGGIYTSTEKTSEGMSLELFKEKDQNTLCLLSLLGLLIEVIQDRMYLRNLVGKLSLSTLHQLVECVGVRACEPLVTRIMSLSQVRQEMDL